MDWAKAIERNREALEAIVAALAALLGGAAKRVPREIHRTIIRLLVPAESAVRRLIVIAARGLVAKPVAVRAGPKLPISRGVPKHLVFRLFDRRKRIPELGSKHGPAPRVHIFGPDLRFHALWPEPQGHALPAPDLDDGLADVQRLRLRLDAAARALADLPRQARRLVQLMAKRQRKPGFNTISPLRPGPAPGQRRKRVHDIDFVLAECHGLAHGALAFDTS